MESYQVALRQKSTTNSPISRKEPRDVWCISVPYICYCPGVWALHLLFCGHRGIFYFKFSQSPQAAPICVHQVQISGQVSNRNEKWQTSSSDLQHLKGLISVGIVTCFALPNSLRIPHEKLKVLFLWLKLSHFNKMSCCSWFAD